MKPTDRRAVFDWDEFVANMNRQSPVDLNETPEEKRKRKVRLEADPEAWFFFYFEAYCTAEPTTIHKKSTKRVISNPEWYEVRPWTREFSKSGRTMMEVLYLTLTGKKRNVVLTSSSYDNACRLLRPYKKLLEGNDRIINDYGIQESHGAWSEGEFVTRNNVAFRGLGAGQSPRGTRNDAVRPDVLLIDDFDTDEDCRNPDIVDKKWEWVERAFLATRSISEPLLVIFCGNIIAEYCCILKAMEMADHFEIVNIRDANGKSTWPQKNTEEMIDRVLSKISYNSAQGEYFNNPITQGKVFPKIHFRKLRPFRDYKFLVAYTDPSYKSGKKNDYKATALMGKYMDEYHVLRMYAAQTTTANMLDWQYDILKWVKGQVPIYFVIEWPWIDDTLKMEIAAANIRHDITLPLVPDEREKPDKFFRIESKLEPLNRNEKLLFNIDFKDSDHMKITEALFKAFSKTSSAHDDPQDAVEGGAVYLDSKTSADTDKVETRPFQKTNSKRY